MNFKLCNRVKIVTTGTLTGIYAQMQGYSELQWLARPDTFINLANMVTLTGRPKKKYAGYTELLDLLGTEGVEYIAFCTNPTKTYISIYCSTECKLDLSKLASQCVTYIGICNDIDLTTELDSAILTT
jgi:hypothetical protein